MDPPNDDQYGTEGVDWLEGDEEDNRVFGLNGDDVIGGGAGDDWLHGGHDHDDLYGGEGNDTLFGDIGLDRLYGGAGDDSLVGGYSPDTLEGGDGADTLLGGVGNDYLNGGGGADTLLGGEGDDSLIGGGGGPDLLDGGAGRDTLVSGEGANGSTLLGGDGADRIYVSGNGHLIAGGTGRDYIEVGLGSNTINLLGITPDGDGHSNGDDIEIDASDIAEGELVINGFVRASEANDWMGSNVTVLHEPDSGLSAVDDGDDLLITSGGVTLIRFTGLAGNSLHDVLPDSRAEHDIVETGTDADEDFMDGYGDDLISGMGGDDWITSLDGNDTILGGDGNDELFGADRGEVAYHNTVRSYVQPLTGAALLDGGAGDDTLTGENGDTLTGGSGNDLLVVNAFNGGQVTITDFTSGEDRLGLLWNEDDLITPGSVAQSGALEQEVLADGSGLMVRLVQDGETRVSVLLEGVNDTLPAEDLRAGLEDVMGTSGSDTIMNDSSFGVVFGGEGDDVLYAIDPENTAHEPHNVSLVGGLGNDTLHAAHAGWAYLEGGEGDDLLDAGAEFVPDDPSTSEPRLTPNDAELRGGAGNDTLIATTHGGTLSGGAGTDQYEIFMREDVSDYRHHAIVLEDYEDGEVITLTDGTEDGSVGPIVQELTAEGLLIRLPEMRYTGVFCRA